MHLHCLVLEAIAKLQGEEMVILLFNVFTDSTCSAGVFCSVFSPLCFSCSIALCALTSRASSYIVLSNADFRAAMRLVAVAFCFDSSDRMYRAALPLQWDLMSWMWVASLSLS